MQRGDNFSLARPGRNVNTDGGVGSLGLPEICPSWSTHRRVGLTGVFPDKLPLECGLAIAVAAEGQAGLDWAVVGMLALHLSSTSLLGSSMPDPRKEMGS